MLFRKNRLIIGRWFEKIDYELDKDDVNDFLGPRILCYDRSDR